LILSFVLRNHAKEAADHKEHPETETRRSSPTTRHTHKSGLLDKMQQRHNFRHDVINRRAVANAHPGHDTHTLGVELKSATPVVEFFPNE
jgi:hypothetical protein